MKWIGCSRKQVDEQVMVFRYRQRRSRVKERRRRREVWQLQGDFFVVVDESVLEIEVWAVLCRGLVEDDYES